MSQASAHQANRIAQALALLPAAGRALLDPRSLVSHESEWIRAPMRGHAPGTARASPTPATSADDNLSAGVCRLLRTEKD
jgi:hypothetical protein